MFRSRVSGTCSGVSTTRSERGSAAVEFALVLPIVTMVVFGIIAFGIGFTQKQTLASAVRDGARFGSVGIYAAAAGSPRTCSDVVAKTRQHATTVGMTGSQVSVSVTRGTTPVCAATGSSVTGSPTASPCANASATDDLTVQAVYVGRLNIPLVMSKSVTMTSSGVYRCEYN